MAFVVCVRVCVKCALALLTHFFFDEKLKQWEQVHALARSLAERSGSETLRKMRKSNFTRRRCGA